MWCSYKQRGTQECLRKRCGCRWRSYTGTTHIIQNHIHITHTHIIYISHHIHITQTITYLMYTQVPHSHKQGGTKDTTADKIILL